MSTAHRQRDPARRAAGKKPDAAAPGNARIVPRLFTSALGGGLPAWAHAIRGDSEARLHGLLLGTGQIPFAVASAKGRDPKSDLRVSRRTTTPGNNLEGINTTVAASGGGAVEQGTRRVDQPAGADRRYSEAAVPWLRCHAQAGFWFSRDPARRQGDHPAPLDGAGAQDRYPFPSALCADCETGPKRSGSDRERPVEQRASRGTT